MTGKSDIIKPRSRCLLRDAHYRKTKHGSGSRQQEKLFSQGDLQTAGTVYSAAVVRLIGIDVIAEFLTASPAKPYKLLQFMLRPQRNTGRGYRPKGEETVDCFSTALSHSLFLPPAPPPPRPRLSPYPPSTLSPPPTPSLFFLGGGGGGGRLNCKNGKEKRKKSGSTPGE